MKLKIYDDSRNYVAIVTKLPHKQPVQGLDKLVNCCVMGANCLIGKDSNENDLYLFFPAESVLSENFVAANNLYRHSELNADKTKKGFFEDNRRVKSVKFKGVVSTGFLIPVASLGHLGIDYTKLEAGHEFNDIDGIEICRKWIRPTIGNWNTNKTKDRKILDSVIDSRLAPEHMDTSNLMRCTRKFDRNPIVVASVKIHGTSLRVYKAPIKRTLRWYERLLKYLGVQITDTHYDYVAASRRVIKSVNFQTFKGKNHFYSEDVWSLVAKEYFDGKLLDGEAVYAEICGSDYNQKAIQPGYSYGWKTPKVYIYRISMINHQGVEVDLSYHQMKIRAEQLGVPTCPELFYGRINDFLEKFNATGENLDEKLQNVFYDKLLDKPSMFDPSVIEEGFCLRLDDTYPKPEIFKVKSPLFLAHETKVHDTDEVDIEDQQSE